MVDGIFTPQSQSVLHSFYSLHKCSGSGRSSHVKLIYAIAMTDHHLTMVAFTFVKSSEGVQYNLAGNEDT
jgi:hypothetical protein